MNAESYGREKKCHICYICYICNICNKRIKLHIPREVGSCKPYVVYKNTPMAYKCEKDEFNLIRHHETHM